MFFSIYRRIYVAPVQETKYSKKRLVKLIPKALPVKKGSVKKFFRYSHPRIDAWRIVL